ncbi:hypothetical protein Mpet_0620 [Methanolacinia petrolearia DSM 11571]|uniref:Uncharacterized protein n=1 Tax=Methanolacinia petrolearia (strain DSM 11571 / OCM 486 / SEBR 4847) TaxID=679926 RepID=E1RI09_METP4|nr:hypothetical protein [Methanolacinia petrolearia]ADN35394.1 hypothetical protein Mpet_0620 [Methanolacinia petrolearia DSM 11571]
MTGSQVPDIGQLTKILTIAIVAILILVVAVGVIFVSKMFIGNNEVPDSPASTYNEYDPLIASTYNEQTATSSAETGQVSSAQTGTLSTDTGISDSINVVDSYIPDDPYFRPLEFDTAAVPEDPVSRQYFQTLYKTTKTFQYDSMSIVVSVGKGPLVVCYAVSDFISETDDGDGVPYYSFLAVTVINNKTNETVATGGYGRTNPSEDEQYLTIPMTGEFRINIYGTGLDGAITVLSGTVPENPNSFSVITNANDVFSQMTTGKVVTEEATEIPEEEEEWWF